MLRMFENMSSKESKNMGNAKEEKPMILDGMGESAHPIFFLQNLISPIIILKVFLFNRKEHSLIIYDQSTQYR